MKSRFIPIIIAIAMSAPRALAWDSEGHMMVAAVAWKNLNDASRARVATLLKLNPDYSQWIAGVAPDQQDQIAFVTAATWPDAIKLKNSGYTFDGDRPPPGPTASQNIGYGDKLQHRYWHFIDTPFSVDETPLVQPISPNAETEISIFEAALRSTSASEELKSYDLVWLEHLVGDVHQPLHATSRFSQDLPNGDQGGNLVDVTCPKPCPERPSPRELHAFWDNVLGQSKNPTDAIAAAERLPRAPVAAAAVTDETAWIKESFDSAKQFAYASPIDRDGGPYPLTAEYENNARTEAEARIALAGVRLANAINANLK